MAATAALSHQDQSGRDHFGPTGTWVLTRVAVGFKEVVFELLNWRLSGEWRWHGLPSRVPVGYHGQDVRAAAGYHQFFPQEMILLANWAVPHRVSRDGAVGADRFGGRPERQDRGDRGR